MAEKIIDEDGENQAIRAFLTLYGNNTVTVEQMGNHMIRSGYAEWCPGWITDKHEQGHLSKGGAQDWLRFMFTKERNMTS